MTIQRTPEALITFQGEAEARENQRAARMHLVKAILIAICTGLMVWLTMHIAPKALAQAAYDAANHGEIK